MRLAPIIIFVYKRLWHTQQTFEALRKNKLADKSDLYIYSDYPNNEKVSSAVAAVRKYIKSVKGFKKITIIERNRHFGLANSVISGVTQVIRRYGKVIVLEDDLVNSPDFLDYMNKALNFYEDDKRIFSVAGYTYPIKIPQNYKEQVYLYFRCCSWGWGTWLDRWEKADWEVKDYHRFKKNEKLINKFNRGGEDLTDLLDFQIKGKIDSWAIRWCYAHYQNNAFCLYPTRSKIKNIGLDGTGTHRSVRKTPSYLDKTFSNIVFPQNIRINKEIIRNNQKYFRHDLIRKIIHLVKRII